MVNALAVALLYWRRKQKIKKRSLWVKYYLTERHQYGEFHHLVGELRLNFREYLWVLCCQFDEILHRVGPQIKRNNTRFWKCIFPADHLAICLRHLATGDSYHSISYCFRLGWSTVSIIVPEVAKATWEELVGVYMPLPKEIDWQDIAAHCVANLCFHIIDVGAFGRGSDGGTLR
ncbi:hypothetical protein FQN60_004283, partial [Etheostoma spectabile]